MRPEVSIIFNAYNHEQYIADALQGFVIQKTTFPFEILVHDDASTDRTAEIIRQYEKKYPEIIKPIYQTENQYSKDTGIVNRIQFGRVQGKYIALCEGDDYWTDPAKLQKQYDAMEKNPQVDMCAHQARCFDCRTGKLTTAITPVEESRVLSAEEVIRGEGGFLATNSLFFRKSLWDNPPAFRTFWPLDYTFQIHGSLRGGILFLNEEMSVYRFMTSGSWTKRVFCDLEKRMEMHRKKQKMLDILNEETHGEYDEAIQWRKKHNDFELLQATGQYAGMLKPEYRNCYEELSAKGKLFLHIKARFPFLVTIKRKITKSE